MQLAVDGLSIWYETSGEGRPLLCLHGWPADHEHIRHDLQPVFTARTGWQRIYPDMPGLGRTPASDGIYSYADVAAIMASFISTLVPAGRFCVAGASTGGYIARWLSYLVPGQIDGFFAYAPAFQRDSSARSLPPPLVVQPNPGLVAGLAED